MNLPPTKTIIRVLKEPFGPLPAGSHVLMNIAYANNQFTFFGSDHHLFRPERYLKPRLGSINFSNELAFGGSTHRCSGRRVAPYLISRGLAMLLENTENIELVDKNKLNREEYLSTRMYKEAKVFIY